MENKYTNDKQIQKMENMLEELQYKDPRLSDNRIGTLVGVSPVTIKRVHKNLRISMNIYNKFVDKIYPQLIIRIQNYEKTSFEEMKSLVIHRFRDKGQRAFRVHKAENAGISEQAIIKWTNLGDKRSIYQAYDVLVGNPLYSQLAINDHASPKMLVERNQRLDDLKEIGVSGNYVAAILHVQPHRIISMRTRERYSKQLSSKEMMQIHYQIATLELLLKCSKQANKLLTNFGFKHLVINKFGPRKIAHYVKVTFDKKGMKHFLNSQEHYPKILQQRELAILSGYLYDHQQAK